MEKLINSEKIETDGIVSSYQLLTLYFPAFILALGYSIATPAIPVFAKSLIPGSALLPSSLSFTPSAG